MQKKESLREYDYHYYSEEMNGLPQKKIKTESESEESNKIRYREKKSRRKTENKQKKYKKCILNIFKILTKTMTVRRVCLFY